MVRGLREGLAGDRLVRVEGVLNGTCNYILTRMADAQVSFSAGLAEAQKLGYAEADPSADLDGADARAKLAILSLVGLRRRIDVGGGAARLDSRDRSDRLRICATSEAAPSGRWRGRSWLADEGGVCSRSCVPRWCRSPPTSRGSQGNQNMVVVEGAFGGEASFSGAGAGGGPTAVSVVSDLEAIARAGAGARAGWPAAPSAEAVEREFDAPHYVRFIVADRPGIIASLADVFSRHGDQRRCRAAGTRLVEGPVAVRRHARALQLGRRERCAHRDRVVRLPRAASGMDADPGQRGAARS